MKTPRTRCHCRDAPPQTAPQAVVNPAGAAALRTRVGIHGTLLNALRRRLSNADYPALTALHTRALSDPSLALLDAWAAVADVLTFYNERYINESYLRTAIEQRSLAELSRLIGYRPGPGVASSVYLAFTLEKDPKQASEETLIPKGMAVKSVPGDGEIPQTFETSEDLIGRKEWSEILPRQKIPQLVENVDNLDRAYVQGTDIQIKPNDEVLLSVDVDTEPKVRTVIDVRIDHKSKVTELSFEETLFSIRRLRAEVVAPVDAFLEIAERVKSFDWLTNTVVAPLDKVAQGEGDTLPLRRLKRLSEYDAQLGVWLESLGEVEFDQAVDELAKDNSPFRVAPQEMERITTFEQIALTDVAKTVCEELLALDTAAEACFKAVLPIDVTEDPLDDTKINTAKAEIDAALGTPPLPPIAKLTSHLAKLTALKDSINAMASDLPVPSADPRVGMFSTSRDDLKSWWGLTDAGNLNGSGSLPHKGATALNDSFTELKMALATGSPQSQVLKIRDQQQNVETTTTLASGPAAERIQALSNSLKVPLETYGNLIQSAALANLRNSEILRQLDHVLLLKEIREEPEIPKKHEKAAALAADADNAKLRIDAACMLASLMKTLVTCLEGRRELFAKEATELLDRHGALASSPIQLARDSWIEMKAVLDKMRQTTSSPPTIFKHATPLQEAIDRIVGTENSQGLIAKFKARASAAEAPSQQILTRLVRDLRSFAALNGGSGFSSPPPPPQAGGIGQVVGSAVQPTEDRLLIRVADEVLSIPDNTAADVVAQLAASFQLISEQELKAKWESIRNDPTVAFVSTVSAPLPLFGHNAPRPIFNKDLKLIKKDDLTFPDWTEEEQDYKGLIHLAGEQVTVEPPFWLRLESRDGEVAYRIVETAIVSRSDYGLTQKATRCHLENPEENWQSVDPANPEIESLRTTLAIVPQRQLEFADAPIRSSIGKDAEDSALEDEYKFDAETDQIELDGIYLGLRAGQFVIIAGEREEFPGVVTRELKRIKFAQHKLRELPGDSVHTRIYLNSGLQHTYIRDTVKIYANVTRATHGETVRQIVGSGDASRPFQRMSLAKVPLTYLPAPTATGAQSTLEVRVNDLRWHEQDSLLDSSFDSRDFVTDSDELGRTSVQFGDGATGARLPTGRENVRAKYRVGLGTVGNVKAGAISQLVHRPLGVKEVTNPLPATGGADAESTEQIRANAPLAVMSLDRLVSVRDYADFARNYAAIEKATATRLLFGGQPTVHVTVAGSGDLPISEDSDLFRNLLSAYRQLGDPMLSVHVQPRELLLIFLSAGVRLKPDYEWTAVEPRIRQTLYETFSFTRRQLAQRVYLSEVQAVVQGVDGVAYVDIDVCDTLAETEFQDALKGSQEPGTTNKLNEAFRRLREPDLIPKPSIKVEGSRIEAGSIRSAQIACLSRAVPDSLFLSEIT